MIIVKRALVTLFCLQAIDASAAFTQFDFGDSEFRNFGTAGNLEMNFTNIATGVNARLTAGSAFASNNGGSSFNGLININFTQSSNASNPNGWESQPVRYTFELFDTGSGDGFSTPLALSEWGLDFFDIDRNDSVNENNGRRRVAVYDIIGLPTSDSNASIVVPGNSVLELPDAGTLPDEANFSFFDGHTDSAQVIRNVANFDDTLDAAQESVGLGLLVTNSSSVEFYYGVGIAEGTSTDRNRNALIGGFGQLSTLPVPEPSACFLAAFGLFPFLRRRRTPAEGCCSQ